LILQVLKGVNNIWVSCLVEVVENGIIRSVILPVPLVSELLLGEVQTFFALVDQMISTEVWNKVVDLVSETLLLMLVLSAASGGADWIGLRVDLDIGIKLNI